MTRAFWAPGRVNLIGEHTDYTGGLVLPAALELGLRLECAPAAGAIRLRSGEFEGDVELDATGAGDGVTGWGRYVAAVAAELDALGRSPVGLVGTIESSLPAGAGLGSSAALEVVVATALCAVAELSLEPVQLALAAQRAEHRAVGVPCGIMDQCVSVLGEEGHAILLDTGSLEHRAIPLPPGLDLLVVDSGVRHRLEDSGYAARRRELEQALVVLEGRSPAAVAPGEAEELAQAARLEPALARRLRHVVSENARVREVVAALTTGAARPDPRRRALPRRPREPPPRLRGLDPRARPPRRSLLSRGRGRRADDGWGLRRLDRRTRGDGERSARRRGRRCRVRRERRRAPRKRPGLARRARSVRALGCGLS